MEDVAIDTSGYHYWLPVPDRGPHGTRHAFKGGRRWDGRAVGTTVCGVADVAMVGPSEMDWIMAPTCLSCISLLKDEQS